MSEEQHNVTKWLLGRAISFLPDDEPLRHEIREHLESLLRVKGEAPSGISSERQASLFDDEQKPICSDGYVAINADGTITTMVAGQAVHRGPVAWTPVAKGRETSLDAAASMAGGKAATLREKVYREISLNGGNTDEELADLLDIPGNTVRPRRRELELDGRIQDSGDRRATASGRWAIVWRVT